MRLYSADEQHIIDFYGEHYLVLKELEETTTDWLMSSSSGEIEHIKSRIKSPESTVQKLARLQHTPIVAEAFLHLNDIIGIRIICRFWDDVYRLAEQIEHSDFCTHKRSKDYISNPKENGYRSYHIIIERELNGVILPIEIQIRTISQDSWAALEHRLKYKHQIKNADLVKKELKRLADEMVSVDLCMQTIKELIESKY